MNQSAEFKTSSLATELFKKHCALKLMHFVANDSENNRSKVKALLNRNAQFASEIIASKIKLSDAGGRQFLSELSAFQYAYWAGDIKMCLLLLDFLNPEDSKNVLEEGGVTFVL